MKKRVVPETSGVLNEWFAGSFPETVSDPITLSVSILFSWDLKSCVIFNNNAVGQSKRKATSEYSATSRN